MAATAVDLQLEDFIATADHKRAGQLMITLSHRAQVNPVFCRRIIDRYHQQVRDSEAQADTTGQRRLCRLLGAIRTEETLALVAQAIWPGADDPMARITAIRVAELTGVEQFMSQLLFAVSCDPLVTVRSAAERALFIHADLDAGDYNDKETA